MGVDPKIFSEVTRNLAARLHDDSVREHHHIGTGWVTIAPSSFGPRWQSYPGWAVPAGYSRTHEGAVHLRGLVSALVNSTYPDIMFTLPPELTLWGGTSGYQHMVVATVNGAHLIVLNGYTIYAPFTTTILAGGWVDLSQIIYRAV